MMMLLPLNPAPLLVVQENKAEDKVDSLRPSLLSLIAFKKGALLLVDSEQGASWMKALSDPENADLMADLVVRQYHASDKDLRPLGIGEPGVYLINQKGMILIRWEGAPPSDIRAECAKAGWVSSIDEFGAFVRNHPDRIDARWEWYGYLENLLRSHLGTRVVAQTAWVVDELLRQSDWSAGPNIFVQPVKPTPNLKVESPLSKVASERIEIAREVLRHSPELAPGWRMLIFFTGWHLDNPSLASFIEELEVPSWSADPAVWPNSDALIEAESQLREEKNWPAMRHFAQSRLEMLARLQAQFHPEVGEEWSGQLTVSKKGIKRISRKERAQSGVGHWLAILFEAELKEGKLSAATDTAHRMATEADAESRLRCQALALELKQETLVELLKIR